MSSVSDSDTDDESANEALHEAVLDSDDDDLEDEESRNYVGFTDKTAAKNLTKQRFLSNASKSSNQISSLMQTSTKNNDSDNDDKEGEGEEVDENEEDEEESLARPAEVRRLT